MKRCKLCGHIFNIDLKNSQTHVCNSNKKTDYPGPSELLEGSHYYLENGNFVFTENYLLSRGYCCQNKCRHCPYENH